MTQRRESGATLADVPALGSLATKNFARYPVRITYMFGRASATLSARFLRRKFMSENNRAVKKLNLLIDQVEADDLVVYFKEPVYVCGDDKERWLDGLDFIRVDLGDDWLNELKREVVATYCWLFVRGESPVLPRGEDAESRREAFRKIYDWEKTRDLHVYQRKIEGFVKAFDGKILVLHCLFYDEPFEVDLSEVDWTAPHSPHVSDYLQRFYINYNFANGWKEIYWVEDAWA